MHTHINRLSRAVVFNALCLILAFSFYGLARAHGEAAVGDYQLEYGWVSEPPVVGQTNAIMLNLTKDGAAPQSAADVSGIKVTVAYGGQTKTLELQPASEESTGEFIAPLIPMQPGVYKIQLSGSFDNQSVAVEFEPEEVQPAQTLQFPTAESAQTTFGANGLMIAALALGLIGTILGGLALVFKSKV